MNGGLLSLWPSLVAAGQILVVCGVLLGSLSYQFFIGELPCPLCVIQRLSFLLACVGPLGILRKAGTPEGDASFRARGFAFCIMASVLGMAVSDRQILLHIMPGDAGYGPPVMGLHLYTWAAVVFVCLILSSAAGLLGGREQSAPLPGMVTNVICGLIIAIATIIALATFAMQGFHWLLPESPTHYELFGPTGAVK
ncbi:hypothetical protein BH09VER1_BH09VER1_52000 [soil metagenome]